MVSLNPLRALSDSQLEEFQAAAERLLGETGCVVQHEAVLRLAEKAGAAVEEASGRVRFPAPLLQELLGQVPGHYTIRNAAGGAFEVGQDEAGFFAITNDPWIIEGPGGAPRHPGLADVRRNTMLAQSLDDVVCLSCMDYPVVEDESEHSSWRALETHLLHHAKHNAVLAASPEKFREWLTIAGILARGGAVAGSRLLTCGVAVVSPLTLTRPNGELLLMACAHDFPIVPTICPMAGTTSPYTLAGTLLTAHAENLMVAALAQLARAGQPFQYVLGPSVSDMRTAHDCYYTLDKVLWKAAGVQLGKRNGFPCGAECGGTMTHALDMQGGAEGMLFMLSAVGSGADLLCGLGSCYNANGLSAELMIVQRAWRDAARFLQRGIGMEDGRLGLANLAEAGPGGQFLTDALTLAYCRGGEFFAHPAFDYGNGPTMFARAHQEIEERLAGYACPVSGDVREGLERYFRDSSQKML